MGLVFSHGDPMLNNLARKHGNILIGDFLGDGMEYMASVCDGRYLDFHILGEYYSPIRTVEFIKPGEKKVLSKIETFTGSYGHDNILIDFRAADGHCCWNGQKLVEVPGGMNSSVIPDISIAIGLHESGGMIIKDNGQILHTFEAPRILQILDSDICAVKLE